MKDHIDRILIEYEEEGITYTIVYSDGEEVMLRSSSDVLWYLENNAKEASA
jgi:hypothetical protein